MKDWAAAIADRKLVYESEWSREYIVGPRSYLSESKFDTDGIQLNAASIKERWPTWSDGEQLDFVTAFIRKPELDAEDQQVMTFLLRAGSARVQSILAYMMPRYENREGALAFLIERITSAQFSPGNCYLSLAKIGDSRAIPALRRRFEAYRRALHPFELHGLHSELSDYQQCCHALWKLDRSPEYERALKELLTHPDEYIRRHAHNFLSEPPSP